MATNKDNEVEELRCMCVCEIDFMKKLRSLKKYFPIAYKYLLFDFKNECCLYDGYYEHNLPTSEEIKAIYGQLIVKYLVDNDKLILIDLEPQEFLLDGYKRDLNVYKGIPYRNEKDKFKINLFSQMKEMKK